MHHTLRFYSSHQDNIIRLYMLLIRLTKVPLFGRLVRLAANRYGANRHGAYLLSPTEAVALVDMAGGVALGPCTCRAVFRNCNNPVESEILLGPARHIFLETKPHDSREITKDEAREILRDSHEKGLIQTVVKCRNDFYAICNCCSCCCVPLRMSKRYGIGQVLRRHRDIVGEFREYQLSFAGPTAQG